MACIKFKTRREEEVERERKNIGLGIREEGVLHEVEGI